MENYSEFEAWAKKNNETPYTEMGGFKIGQKVTFTNEAGVIFKNLEILGFVEPNPDFLPERCVHLKKDAWWFPLKLSEIKAEN